MRLEDGSMLARLAAGVLLFFGATHAFAADAELNSLNPKELKSFERRTVTLHLASGRDLEGNVFRVTDRLIILERSRALTYVEIGHVEAVTVAPRVAPSRAEVDALSKTLAPPIPIELDWKSIPDDGPTRILVSRGLEDLAAALRATASDADGKAALGKISRVSLGCASPSSASVSGGALVVRYDVKNAPSVRTLQSLIEKQL